MVAVPGGATHIKVYPKVEIDWVAARFAPVGVAEGQVLDLAIFNPCPGTADVRLRAVDLDGVEVDSDEAVLMAGEGRYLTFFEPDGPAGRQRVVAQASVKCHGPSSPQADKSTPALCCPFADAVASLEVVDAASGQTVHSFKPSIGGEPKTREEETDPR